MALLVSTSLPSEKPAYRRASFAGFRRGLNVLLALFLTTAATAANAPAPQEYQVKAVFLFNFAQFVEWPPSSFAHAENPLVIGVLGRDPFDGALEEAVRGEKANGRNFVVRAYARVEDVEDCQILFVSRSEAARLPAILNELKGQPVLTVSDAENFAEQGGMIRFVTEQNRTRFRINLDAAKAAGLTLSSKLLRLGSVVSGKAGP